MVSGQASKKSGTPSPSESSIEPSFPRSLQSDTKTRVKLVSFTKFEEVSKILSYIVVFMVCIILGGMVIKFIGTLIKWSGASGFDRFLGVLFGLTRGLIVLFVIFLLLPSSVKSTDLINQSKITPIIEKYAPQIEAYFRDLIDNRNLVDEALEVIEPIKEELAPDSEDLNPTQEES